MKRSKVDVKELKAFRGRLDSLAGKTDLDAFYRQAAKELAARLLTMVKKRTPVDTGNLRGGKNGTGGWTAGEVRAVEGGYEVEVFNPANYASYVEFGHRTRLNPEGGRGWVKGRFMLQISSDELEAMAPKILERKLKKFLSQAVNGSGQ